MKNARTLSTCCFVILLFAFSCPAQKPDVPGTKEVKVYFMFIGPAGTESKILPLKRQVAAAAPLFPAIAAMLVDPTEAEQKLGYGSAGYGGMKLESATIARGVARIEFSRVIRTDYNPGDLQTLYFEEAVTKTAKQFPAVKKVMVCVNGINEFGIGLVEDRPFPCPKSK